MLNGKKGTDRGIRRKRRIGKRRHPMVLFLLSHFLQTRLMKQSLKQKKQEVKVRKDKKMNLRKK
jgi:hypothetical protein